MNSRLPTGVLILKDDCLETLLLALSADTEQRSKSERATGESASSADRQRTFSAFRSRCATPRECRKRRALRNASISSRLNEVCG